MFLDVLRRRNPAFLEAVIQLHQEGRLPANSYAIDLDAVERNAMFTSTVDFNRRAERWAAAHGKPIVGNGDVHRLRQVGTTYSLIDAEPNADAICEAVRAGRVQVQGRPLSWMEVAQVIPDMFLTDALTRWRAPRPARRIERQTGALISQEPTPYF